MLDWTDLPKHNDKLFIEGFAPTTRDLAPWDDKSYDCWAVNEEYAYPWMKRMADVWFQMHPRWDFTRTNNMNHFNHPNWLMNREATCMRCGGSGELTNTQTHAKTPCPECEGGIYKPPEYRTFLPVVMQEHWDDIPNSVKFPLKEATELYGLGYPYFMSSVSFMLTLAYMMDYKHVELYGFEMGTDTEYHYQRANGEFVMGFLQAKGMKIVVPQQSGLLKGELYGYRSMKTGFRQNLEARTMFLKTQEVQGSAQVQQLAGALEVLKKLAQEEVTKENILKMLELSVQEYDKARHLYSVVQGAQAETQNLTGLYDKYFTNGSEAHQSGEDFAEFTNAAYQ